MNADAAIIDIVATIKKATFLGDFFLIRGTLCSSC